MELKSHFTFSKQQRSGILILLLLIISLLCIYWFVDFSDEDILDISSDEIVSIQKELDSLRQVEIEKRALKIYPFNPNYLTDYRGSSIGMSTEEIDRLLDHRQEGKWINSTIEFQQITGVSDSLLNVISPYFKFPEWVANPTSKKNFGNDKTEISFVEKPYHQKMDLNEATLKELQQVSGIGAVLSKRIVDYRERLGGFSADSQLHEVYGVDSTVVQRTLNLFTVKTPKEIIKININTASASDIATIPGVSFELAKDIWEYRRLREKINTLDELSKIDGLTQRKLQLIQLYLSFE